MSDLSRPLYGLFPMGLPIHTFRRNGVHDLHSSSGICDNRVDVLDSGTEDEVSPGYHGDRVGDLRFLYARPNRNFVADPTGVDRRSSRPTVDTYASGRHVLPE